MAVEKCKACWVNDESVGLLINVCTGCYSNQSTWGICACGWEGAAGHPCERNRLYPNGRHCTSTAIVLPIAPTPPPPTPAPAPTTPSTTGLALTTMRKLKHAGPNQERWAVWLDHYDQRTWLGMFGRPVLLRASDGKELAGTLRAHGVIPNQAGGWIEISKDYSSTQNVYSLSDFDGGSVYFASYAPPPIKVPASANVPPGGLSTGATAFSWTAPAIGPGGTLSVLGHKLIPSTSAYSYRCQACGGAFPADDVAAGKIKACAAPGINKGALLAAVDRAVKKANKISCSKCGGDWCEALDTYYGDRAYAKWCSPCRTKSGVK